MAWANGFDACDSEIDVLRALAYHSWAGDIPPSLAAEFGAKRINELRAADSAGKKKEDPRKPMPRGALIELVETPDHSEPQGVVKPNTLRINGVEVLCPREDTLEIENLDEPDRMEALTVKVRMYARRVVIGQVS